MTEIGVPDPVEPEIVIVPAHDPVPAPTELPQPAPVREPDPEPVAA